MGFKYWGEPFAKVYREMEGKHQALRIAAGIKKAVEEMPISLQPEKAIVGQGIARGIINFHFGSGIQIDHWLANDVLKNEQNEEIKKEVDELLAYFKNEDSLQIFRDSLTEEENRGGKKRVFWAGEWGGHTLLDYQSLLMKGTSGLRKKIQENKKNFNAAKDLEWFEALETTCESLDILAKRYADAAGEAAKVEEDLSLKKELLEIERICRKVPHYPAETWREALQCFWFTFIFDGIDSPGRFDQYMIPFLRNSINSGELSMEEAQELLEKLWLCFEEVRAWNLCISGQTAKGVDASNELSYMILDAAKKYKFQAPNLTMRVHSGTPIALWNKAVEVIMTGIGMPALYNDEVVIPALLRFGIPIEDARNYAMNGCNQIDIQGKSHMGLEDGELNLLKCLELALSRGKCRITGEQLGLDTGDPRKFKSFDEVMAAYKKQVEYFTKVLTDVANKSQKMYAEHAPNAFRSLLIEGCIDRGKDFNAGGPIYNHGQILTEGIGNTADSLYAIKKKIFEEKSITMEELLAALDSNFEGVPQLQRMLQSTAHYGNDEDEVDALAAEIIRHFFKELMKYKTYRGGIYGGGCSVFTRSPEYGQLVGATPDGRKAKVPVADSIGPVQGRDAKGPTAVFNSAAKMDHTLALSGHVLNIRFDKSAFHQAGAAEQFRTLIQTYFKRGGQQVQVNILNSEDLKAAKANPEAYKNLVVRVGGFSAYFVELDPSLQEEIITRTSHVL